MVQSNQRENSSICQTYPGKVNHSVCEEDKVHAGPSHHFIVLRQKHLQAVLQGREGWNGLIHLGHLHIQIFTFIPSGFWSISASYTHVNYFHATLIFFNYTQRAF